MKSSSAIRLITAGLFLVNPLRADLSLLSGAVRARQIIASAVAAEGGEQAIRHLERLEYQYSGQIFDPLQSRDPHRAPDAEPTTVTAVFDFEHGRGYQAIETAIAGIHSVAAPTIYKSGVIYDLDAFQRQYTARKGEMAGAFDSSFRYLPPVVLATLLRNLRSATYSGDGSLHGTPVELVDFSWNETARYRLAFSRDDHHLLQLTFVVQDPVAGDDEVTIEYLGAQRVDGLRFPERAVANRRGKKYLDLTLHDVRVNQAVDSSKFDIPAGDREVPPAVIGTTRLADGVYEVSGMGGGIYRVPFIDAGSYVVVFDAVLNVATSRQVMEQIRKTVGDKPIRYVVLSHFHNDHAAGVGAYVEAGARVVTTPGNEDIVSQYARARSLLSGDARPAAPSPSFVEVTSDRLDLRDGEGRLLVVFRIPGVPHVDEMLALYDPATRTIFDGDLYATFFPFSPSYQVFAEWLQSPAAPEVLNIAGVHHPMIEKSRFVAMAAQAAAKGTAMF